jgi:very-short-patch-repair endonuclease
LEPSAREADSRRPDLQAKPIGNYIVDFYAPAVRLVIEVDGSHHFNDTQASYDKQRTEYLERLGLKVLRFDDRQVLTQTDFVIEEIFRSVSDRTLP